MPNIFITFIILHYIGDYYLQPKKLVDFKKKSLWGVLIHSIIYSVPAVISLALVKSNDYLVWISIMCGTHFIIDFIKFFIKPIYYSPKDEEENSPKNKEEKSNGKHLLKVNIIYFADQFLHLAVIAVVSIWFLQNNPDISMKQSILDVLNIKSQTLIILFKSMTAFIVLMQPVSHTFYEIFDIKLLAQTKPSENTKDKNKGHENKDDENEEYIDVKGTGKIIGFMERIIMLCLLIMGEYTAIGFVVAGKSIIRLNSNVKQEFFIIGTFYGIITSIITYIVFFKL